MLQRALSEKARILESLKKVNDITRRYSIDVLFEYHPIISKGLSASASKRENEGLPLRGACKLPSNPMGTYFVYFPYFKFLHVIVN